MASDEWTRQRTHLIARVGSPQEAGTAALFRVGSYEVVNGLTRAPGAWLLEAVGPDREPALLQVVHCRKAARGEGIEERIARRTTELLGRDGLAVMAHGSVPRADGSRLIFWALPWPFEGERVAHAPQRIESLVHLITMGLALARRMKERHARQAYDPLLSHHVVLVRSQRIEVLGVPLSVPPVHLAENMIPPPLAPEESATLLASESGDLWRLGQTLRGLSTGFGALPSGWKQLIDRLIQPSPVHRPSGAEPVIEAFTELKRELDGPEAHRPPDTLDAAAHENISQLALVYLGPIPAETSTAHWPAPTQLDPVADGQERGDGVDLSEPTAPDQPIQVPPWAFFFEGPDFHQFVRALQNELTYRRLSFNIGQGVAVLATAEHQRVLYFGLADVARRCHRQPMDMWPGIIEEALEQLLREGQGVGAPKPLRPSHEGLDADDVDSTPVAYDASSFRSFTDPAEVPTSTESVGVPTVAPQQVVVDVRPVPERDRSRSVTPTAPVVVASGGKPTSSNRWKTIVALILGALGGALGVKALDAPSRPPPTRPRSATPLHDVVVTASPPTAVVVSERDGLILGQVPQLIMVPPNLEVSVLIAARGHEPQRLILPHRGSVSTSLLPLPPDPPPCVLALPGGEPDAYEGVEATVQADGQLVIPGAAVIRAKDRRGARSGAWAIRCPAFGGQGSLLHRRPSVVPARIEVDGPSGAVVYLNDRNVGPVPARKTVLGAFTKVSLRTAVRSVSRWIPTETDVSVQMSFEQ